MQITNKEKEPWRRWRGFQQLLTFLAQTPRQTSKPTDSDTPRSLDRILFAEKMQSIRSGTRLLQRNRFSISNTLRFTSSSPASLSENESRRLGGGFDYSRSTRAFDSPATYLISSLTKAVSFSSVLPVSKPRLSFQLIIVY